MKIDWFEMIFGMLFSFLQLFSPILILAGILIVVLIVLVMVHFGILYRKGYRMKKSDTVSTYVKRGAFQQLFYDLPRRIALDLFKSDPDKFPENGIILFVGEQGAGKSSSIAYQLLEWQGMYPKLKVATNMCYKFEDLSISHWKQLLDFKNDQKGVVNVLDEMQLWFNCNESKDFPQDMLPHISQNRKNVRVIMGTANDIEEISKPMRKRVKEVRKCYTFLNALCVVHRIKPVCDINGNIKRMKSLGWYFFVHSDELRECYDTYKIISRLSESGFKSEKPTQNIVVSVKSD